MNAFIANAVDGVTCPLCGANVAKRPIIVAYRRTQHPYLGCAKCGLVFEDPTTYATATFDSSKAVSALTSEDQRAFQDTYGESIEVASATGVLYAQYEYDDTNDMVADLEARISHHLKQAFSDTSGLRILEVGCANGFLLRRLERKYHPIRALGVDPSPIAREQASRYGTAVIQGTLDSIELAEEKFDVVIILGNLMLHADPKATLSAAVNHLALGGVLIFDTKNLRCATRQLALFLSRFESLARCRPVRNFMTRNFTNGRHFFGKRQLYLLCAHVRLNIDEMRSHPPRAIRYRNRHAGSNGLAGVVWRLFDWFDAHYDERAWLEVRCSPAKFEAKRG